jgi:hypothetical protein
MSTTTTPVTGAMLLVQIRAGKLELAKLPVEQLLLVFAEQEAEKLAAEKSAQENASYSVKVGRSGTVSVSGFGRYPLSHYLEQWAMLSKLMPAIMAFCVEHKAEIEERIANPLAENAPNPSKSFKLKLA